MAGYFSFLSLETTQKMRRCFTSSFGGDLRPLFLAHGDLVQAISSHHNAGKPGGATKEIKSPHICGVWQVGHGIDECFFSNCALNIILWVYKLDLGVTTPFTRIQHSLIIHAHTYRRRRVGGH